MTKKKNILKNRKKNAEKERLEAKKHNALLDDELRDENDDLKVIEIEENADDVADVSKKKPAPIKDSKGHKIPTEAERKQKKAKVIDFKNAKRKQSANGRHAGRMDDYGHATIKTKRKVKYVLDSAAKKWLKKTLIIAGIAIVSIIVTIVALNSAENARKAAENAPINADQVTQSLVGMPPEGKKLVSATHKYDGFLTIEQIDIGELYDLDITAEEEMVLESRGQIIRNGIVGYNAEMSSTAKQVAEKEAEAQTVEKATETPEEKSRAEQFAKALNENNERQGA